MRRLARTIALIAGIVPVALVMVSAGADGAGADAKGKGKFEGHAKLERLDDDPFVARFRLISELRFDQAGGDIWVTPSNCILDGRSVPPMFVHLFGHPFEREFRKTAITYDYAVISKYHPWKKAQRMFYEGMLTEGVEPVEAKVVYMLLSASGSRWASHGPDSCFSRCHTGNKELEWRPRVNDEKLVSLLDWVRKENPSLEAIDQRASDAIIEKGPHIFGAVR